MKKIISILIILYSFLVSGCGRETIIEKSSDISSEQATTTNEEYEVIAPEPSYTVQEEDKIDESEPSYTVQEEDKIDESEPSVIANKTDQFVVNPYFYEKEENFLQTKAKYFAGHSKGGWVEKTVYANVDMLRAYEEGNVYKFTIDMDNIDGYFKETWLTQYFYVTKDRIYIVTPRDRIYPFSRNDEINMLDTDEKLVEWSTIVCQEDEIIEEQGSDYRSITKTGNQITYYAYSLKGNGDVWWSMYYTWEEGRGLISCGFRHGPGENYDITLYDIEELTVVG